MPKHPGSKSNNKKSNQKYIPSFKSKSSLLSNITTTRSPATNKRVHTNAKVASVKSKIRMNPLYKKISLLLE